MLTPDYLDTFTDPLLELYEEFTQSIMNDIARRIVKMGTVTPSAAWQMQRITESGKVFEHAIKEIAKLTGKSQAELKRLFKDAGVRAMRFDDAIYKAAGLSPIPLNLSPAMVQVLAAGLRKTQGIINNLTMTTAINAHKKFIDTLDLAYLQVTSGTMSYDQAIRAALKTMAANGLSVVNYASGRTDLMDVAVRRATLTGVQQTVGELQTKRADEMQSDLVQTSAHFGARNVGSGPMNHEGWQGRIFSRSGNDKTYPNFITETGYGTGAGLCGYNCRHSFYPFFKGISVNAYNEMTRDLLAQKQVTYKGRKIGQYEASQIQRKMERDIRKYKREAGVLGAAGMDNRLELGQVKNLQADLRQFVRETHLPRQAVREGPRAPAKVIVEKTAAPAIVPVASIVPAKTPVAAELIPADSPVAPSALQEFEKRIQGQKFETAGIFSRDGSLIFEKDGSENRVPFEWHEIIQMQNAVLTHNHPSGGPFSMDDYQIFLDAKVKEIRAVGNEWTYILTAPDGYDYSKNSAIGYDLGIAQRKAQAAGVDTSDWKEYNHQTSKLWADAIGLDYQRILTDAEKR